MQTWTHQSKRSIALLMLLLVWTVAVLVHSVTAGGEAKTGNTTTNTWTNATDSTQKTDWVTLDDSTTDGQNDKARVAILVVAVMMLLILVAIAAVIIFTHTGDSGSQNVPYYASNGMAKVTTTTATTTSGVQAKSSTRSKTAKSIEAGKMLTRKMTNGVNGANNNKSTTNSSSKNKNNPATGSAVKQSMAVASKSASNEPLRK